MNIDIVAKRLKARAKRFIVVCMRAIVGLLVTTLDLCSRALKSGMNDAVLSLTVEQFI